MRTRKVVAISVVVCTVNCDFVTAYDNPLGHHSLGIQLTQVGCEAKHMCNCFDRSCLHIQYNKTNPLNVAILLITIYKISKI